MTTVHTTSLADRPWLLSTKSTISRETIRAWRAATWNADIEGNAFVRKGQSASLLPGISVVIPTFSGAAHLLRCLSSLVGQTLGHDMFEILVVPNGPDDGTRALLDGFRNAHRTVDLRVVRLSVTGASPARNAGVAAARKEYITFVDDDDYVSPRFLEALLANARPDVISMSSLVNVGVGGLEPDNYINDAVTRLAGKLTAPPDIRVATSANAGKAVSTDLAKRLPYDVDLTSGEDVLFWTTLVTRNNVAFMPCSTADEAIYYRVLRNESVSRQALTFDFAVRQRIEVIARLDKLAELTDGAARGLVIDRMNHQTDFIRRYLDGHPDEHRRVVQVLDAKPMLHFPYARMNLSANARGLAIAYAFPPYADTSAVVMAKRIRAKGEIVDVVSNAMDSIRKQDTSLRRISGPFVARERAVRTPTYFADFGSMERFATAGLDVIREWQVAGRRYEWIYSRAQFAASHFLAAVFKIANPSTRWIAEFSDPLARDVHGRERGTPIKNGELVATLKRGLRAAGIDPPSGDNCFVWCEEVAYALADELIFTNDNQLEHMLSYCTRPELVARVRRKATVSAQPTLGREFYTMADHAYLLDPLKVHVAYFGNFYATRGLDEVLIALARLAATERDSLRLHAFTSKPEDLIRRTDELGISDLVTAGPYVAYLAFLGLTTRFDCLIVNDAITAGTHARNPFLPSKWADYRGSGTPVWGLVEPDSALSREPLDHVSRVGDIDGAIEVLSALAGRQAEVTAAALVPSPTCR